MEVISTRFGLWREDSHRMRDLLVKLFQYQWSVLSLILMASFFSLYISDYGVTHHDFNLTKYQNVSIEKNLNREEILLLNRYLNETKKVLNSYNYPDDNHVFISLKNENSEYEYITIYPQENMIYKGYFLDLSYDRMMDRPFNYYIMTHDIVEFLDNTKIE